MAMLTWDYIMWPENEGCLRRTDVLGSTACGYGEVNRTFLSATDTRSLSKTRADLSQVLLSVSRPTLIRTRDYTFLYRCCLK